MQDEALRGHIYMTYLEGVNRWDIVVTLITLNSMTSNMSDGKPLR